MDTKVERSIVIAMIVSTEFMKSIQPMYVPLETSFTRVIAEWCNDYFNQYDKAPGKHIEDLFFANKSLLSSDDEEELVKNFLDSVSQEYEREQSFNVQYVTDSAKKYFKILSLRKLNQNLSDCIANDDVEDAENLVKKYEEVSTPTTTAINPFDIETITKAFSESSGSKLFEFPGDLGNMFGGPFLRQQLVAFVGKSGVGKTWWLLWMAMLGLMKGYNVVFVSLEMSEEEIVRRIHQHINAALDSSKDKAIAIPVMDCESNQDNSCTKNIRECRIGLTYRSDDIMENVNFNTSYIPCYVCSTRRNKRDYSFAIWFRILDKKNIDARQAILKIDALLQAGILKQGRLKLLCYPDGQMTMGELHSHLDHFEYYDGYIVDMVVTDYADKFKLNNREEKRHQIANVWKEHKALSQSRKCLVVTASQSNTMRTRKDIKQGDWAESIAKIELSDIAISLNQKDEEKNKGLMRVGLLKKRGGRFDLVSHTKVLMSYDIGRTYLDSYYG